MVVVSVPSEAWRPPLTLYCCTRVVVVVVNWLPPAGVQLVAV